MGADVAAVLARAGCRTVVVEPSAARRETLPEHCAAALAQLEAAHRADRIQAVASLQEVGWDAVDLVIECIPERLAIKQELFADLVGRARPTTLLCSNSSSFPISAIAQGLHTQERMVGLPSSCRPTWCRWWRS
jgi:3-hydroxybutyryl-CoA dehydrogenase